MNKIKILLADDHPLILEGFKSLLGKSERFEIVGEAENGQALMNLVKTTQADIVLTDIGMPLVNGLTAIEKIKKENDTIKLVILTMHEERAYIINALKAGAQGYLLKNIERAELEKAIITIYEGGKYFSATIQNILAESITHSESADNGEITPREKEVLQLVAKGNSTKQIADMLGISIRTVETHRVNMLKKLKVNNTAELISKTIELKLLS
jgi:DNA-binding NarL/FixJ family response regulator